MTRLWWQTKSDEEPESITLDSIDEHLKSYPSRIRPDLRKLDESRFHELPNKLAQRKKAGGTLLEPSDITSLVEWKLKHGTYRPKLASLVASNSDEDLITTTKDAFAIYEADNDAYINSIQTLTKLKGIGPATASLILSCYDPEKIPFFSDQLFRYSLWKRTSGQGWDRKIKYNLGEYKEMFEKVKELKARLEKEHGKLVSVLDLEKFAYVLAKGAQPTSKRYPIDGGDGVGEKFDQLSKTSEKRKSNETGHDNAEDSESPKPNAKRSKRNKK